MDALNEDDQLYTEENERKVWELILLVLFWKFKAIPSFAVQGFLDEKFLELYRTKGHSVLSNFTFVRLTYRGRKTAEKSYKIFRKSLANETSWVPTDPYSIIDDKEDKEELYLMHHKRFLEEIDEGDIVQLVSRYERRIEPPME